MHYLRLYTQWSLVSGLAGKDSWQQALADQYMELVEDMFKELVKVFFENDEDKKVGFTSLTLFQLKALYSVYNCCYYKGMLRPVF